MHESKTTTDLTDLQIAQEQCDEWQAACRSLERINAEQSAEIERLRKALAFAASAIKSGEPWTETCERELRVR